MSEVVRRLVSATFIAVYLAVAPSTVPPWKAEPRPLPAALLVLGEPTPSVAYAPGRGRRGES